MSFQAAIFDLDGTLLDTLIDLANSYNHALQELGFQTHPVNAYRYFVGDGAKMCATRALPSESRDEPTILECLKLFLENYSINWNVHTRPYEGISEMLDALSKTGVKMAILSNKPQDNTDQCVKEYLSAWKFEAIFGQRTGIPKKPDPATALEISHQLNIPPQEILFLGDTSTDMKTAFSAGMYPVGALWGFRPLSELRQSGAKATIQYPTDILTLLK